MKYVNAREYISVLRDLINDGKDVTFLVTGSSMSPFLIHERDTVYLRKPVFPLKKGDIVFYQRDSGQFVLHRIINVSDEGTYDLIGDNQTQIEHDIRQDQIFAYVYKVKRKGKIIEPGSFWWEFFSDIWTSIVPLRKTVVKTYSVFRH